MATQTLNTRIALKSDTTANWAKSTLVLLKGEQAIEITESGAYKIKIGDGVKTFAELPYATMTPEEISALIGDGSVQNVTLASGTNNGTLKLTVDGTTTDNIAVKGLGSAAYTNTSAYATAAQGTLATNAVRKVVSGTENGTISVTTGTGAATDIAVKGLGSAAYKGAGASQGQVPVNGAALGTTANVPVVTNTSGQLVPHASGALGSAAFKGAETFATAAQGAKADKSVQSVSITSGTNNGTIKLTVNGNATDNIAVKGLGSAAYTASGAYATSAQGAKADAAMPKAGGTFTGTVTLAADPTDALQPTTKQYVDAKISSSIAASDAMVFKGTLGTNGTTSATTGIGEGDKFYTIEGNTSGGSSIVPNGGGVYAKSYYNSNLPGTKFCRPDYSIVTSILTSPAPVQPSYTAWVGSCTANGTDVFSGATGASKLSTYPKLNAGNLVDIIGESGTRYQVRIAAKYIGYVEKSNIKNPNTPAATTTKKYPFVGKVTASKLNVRKKPGTEHPLLPEYPMLNKDNLINVLGVTKDTKGDRWYKVSITKKEYVGYVSAKYIIKA